MPNPLVRPFDEAFKTDMWAHAPRAFVIGGGPSAKDFPWERLEGELVVGVNKAFTLPQCTIVTAMDRRFYE